MVTKYVAQLRPRDKESHKGDYGHVFILAGSQGLTGAAYLASQAALLAGSGLVTLGIPRSLNTIMEIKLTEVMTLPLDETKECSFAASAEKKIIDFALTCDAAAIGPGVSLNGETQSLVRSLVKKLNRPIVLDADGLNAYADNAADLANDGDKPIVITPHPGELARLTGMTIDEIQRDRQAAARSASIRFGAITVLKGFQTVVAFKDEIYVNETGNPGMASGGAGDVLTGIITSLMGQGLDPFGAAKLGCHVHGMAGDLALREYGEISLTAVNVLEFLPRAFKAL